MFEYPTHLTRTGCKTTILKKLKKLRSDWLTPRRAVGLIQHLSQKMRFSWVSVLPISAEGVDMRGEKIKSSSIAYFLSNTSTRNYQNRHMYVEVTVSQRYVTC